MKREVAIVGVGQTKSVSRRDDVTYPELMAEAVAAAFADCRLKRTDVDAVVLALAPESFIGINHAERWCVDGIGATGKPLIRIQTGGTVGMTAVQVAAAHVASGMYKCVLVAGADKISESGQPQVVLNKIWEPLYERDLPLNTVVMLAMQAVRYMNKYGVTNEEMSLVAVKNHANAMNNPYAHIRKAVTLEEVLSSRVLCWPIRLYDACPASTAACAVLVCSEDLAEEATDTPAWIKGMGNNSDTYYIGDRVVPFAEHEYADADTLAEAAQKAYVMADITDPWNQIDVVETYAPFSMVELHNVEALGLCQKGEAAKLLAQGAFSMGGHIPINPSGGVMCSNPISATAMIRVAEAALQIQGKAGARQVPGAKTSVATGWGGSHQFAAIMVLRNEK